MHQVFCGNLFDPLIIYSLCLVRDANQLSCNYCSWIPHSLCSAWGDSSPGIRIDLVKVCSPRWTWSIAIQRATQWSTPDRCQGPGLFSKTPVPCQQPECLARWIGRLLAEWPCSWVGLPALSFTSHVTLGKFLSLSESPFSGIKGKQKYSKSGLRI